jgi:hypothetical protein
MEVTRGEASPERRMKVVLFARPERALKLLQDLLALRFVP